MAGHRTKQDVIILGAGAAGLAAARVLSEGGCSALIIEARDRIGGRILTLHDSAYSLPVELGAEFIHGRPEATWKLIREAGLIAYDIPFEHHERHGNRLIQQKSYSRELKAIFGGLSRLGSKDISVAEYLRHHRLSPRFAHARRTAVDFVKGFDAADLERMSAKSLAQEQKGLGNLEEEKQFRLLKGYGSLVDYLRASLDTKQVKLQLKTVVSEIRWQKSKVEVHCSRAGHPTVFRAPRVIITLPLGVIQLPPEVSGSIRFSPDIPEKRHAAMQLGSGPIVKVVLKFHEPFWEDKSVAKSARADESLRDAAFLHDPQAAFPTWWTPRPLHEPILTGWAGGPKALALTGLSHRRLMEAALESLHTLFGLRRSRIAAFLDQARTYDWPADPFARGAYSYVTVGGLRARSVLSKPILRTLFFAGEATDTSGQASTVAGALVSGQRAAREVLATM